jgi:hypothetical protein
MSSQEWRFPGWADNPDICTLTAARVDYEKAVSPFVDALDDFFARPFPASRRIAQVSNVLVRALGRRKIIDNKMSAIVVGPRIANWREYD